jgi:hypothetical protein
MSDTILFIVEGEKLEPQVIKNIGKIFFKNETKYIYPYKTNIYSLWNEYNNKNKLLHLKLDIYDFLIERIENDPKHNVEIDELSRIYLFFDYDRHHPGASDSIIQDMLTFFDNETENGKLYISYPMGEALKDFNDDESFRDNIVPIKKKSDYKELVGKRTKYQDIREIDYNDWGFINLENTKKANFIVNNTYIKPSSMIPQDTIFDGQLERFINPSNQVAVLSGFPFFLIEYYGKDFHDAL